MTFFHHLKDDISLFCGFHNYIQKSAASLIVVPLMAMYLFFSGCFYRFLFLLLAISKFCVCVHAFDIWVLSWLWTYRSMSFISVRKFTFNMSFNIYFCSITSSPLVNLILGMLDILKFFLQVSYTVFCFLILLQSCIL